VKNMCLAIGMILLAMKYLNDILWFL